MAINEGYHEVLDVLDRLFVHMFKARRRAAAAAAARWAAGQDGGGARRRRGAGLGACPLPVARVYPLARPRARPPSCRCVHPHSPLAPPWPLAPARRA